MKPKLVVVPSIQKPIQTSPGFAKKALSTFKLDLLGLCQFGCAYCSSNAGNYLRIHRERFADLTAQQLGERLLPSEDPALTFLWPDVLDHLEAQLQKKPRTWGHGETLVVSMLTDAFSPVLVADGTTRRALDLVLARTSFRVRVLTKNAVVGQELWCDYFRAHPGRFVVGLSTGTLDDPWAQTVEVGTSHPTARLRALRALQEAGVPTYGMLCPIFPDGLVQGALEALVDRVDPSRAEHVWAEPYNDRLNWQAVRAAYAPGSVGHEWFTRVYARGDRAAWSRYATELYVRLRDKARREGWLAKLRYLLYEGEITAADANEFRGLEGVLLQSKPRADGRSANPHLAVYQNLPRDTARQLTLSRTKDEP